MSTGNHHLTGMIPPRSMLKGRYLIVGVVGRGGMGAVYEAVDTRTNPNIRVAIKEISLSRAQSPADIARAKRLFHREANILRSLDHPNLPHVYDFFEENDRYYLVMEFIVGKSLWQLLAAQHNHPLPTDSVMGYAYQLSRVLDYLHRQYPPIIFRDLKPANVMVTDNGHVYLIDFGIARFFKPGQISDTDHLGTIAYVAPQQLDGEQSNTRSDLYSLGATLHHCLSGKLPAYASNDYKYPDISGLNPYVPPGFAQIIMSLVEKEERLRPKSAEAVCQNLEVVIRHSSTFKRTLAQQTPQVRFILPGDASGASHDDETYGKPTPPPPPPARDWMMEIEQATTHFARWCSSCFSSILWPGVVSIARALLTLVSFLLVTLWHLVKNHRPASVSFPDVMQFSNQAMQFSDRARLSVIGGFEKVKLRITSWSTWSSRVLTPSFVGLLLLRVALLITLCSYMLHTSNSYTVTAFGLSLIFVFLSSTATINPKIRDPFARNLFLCMAFVMLFACIALLGTADVQQILGMITLSQLLSVALVTAGIATLLRTANHLTWVDSVTMILICSASALLQFALGPQVFQQIPGITNGTAMQFNIVLTLLLIVFALRFLRVGREFTGFDRFTLFVVAIIYASLQFTVGPDELRHTPPFTDMDTSTNILLHAAYIHVLLISIPPLSAGIALFIGRRFAYASRFAIFLLAIACAFMQNALVNEIKLLLPSSPVYPLLTRVLDLFTLNQIFTHGGLITAAILLLIYFFRPQVWLERAAILLVAVACALLQSAFWSEEVLTLPISSNSIGSGLFKQYAVVAANQLLADLLLLFVAVMVAIPLAGAFLHLTHPNTWPGSKTASLPGRFAWVDKIVRVLYRLTFFGITLISTLLILFFGGQSLLLSQPLQGANTSMTTNTLTLIILAILTVIAHFRTARPFNRWDCITLITVIIACEMLTYGNRGVQKSSLPLLSFLQQFISNLLHSNTSHLLLLIGTIGTAIISLLWLQRVPSRPRKDMALLFLLAVLSAGALISTLLYSSWPILLPVALLMLIHGVFLMVQMERVRA